MEFDLTIRNDDYGNETSWEVIHSSGSTVVSGSNYDDDESYTNNKCTPDACYTMTIFDSYGDGLSEGEKMQDTLSTLMEMSLRKREASILENNKILSLDPAVVAEVVLVEVTPVFPLH
jgi:hypothetical protein